jgi:DNA-binding NarL/FixJ family response regulator
VSAPIRTLVADDQRVVREGLVMLLGLLPGVEAVVRGEVALDPAVQRHLVEALAGGAAATGQGAPALPDGLTPREAEVLALIADGLSNAEIAGRLVVSEATVKSHVNHLFAKIGAHDRAQAVAYAYRNHLAP